MTNQVPETMQAVVLNEYGGPLQVRQISIPKPGPGEVLVRMAAAPINPSDLGFIAGGYRSTKTLPVVPGNEGSGRVVAAGSGLLPRLWLGRRVACASSSRHDGSWAEYMVTKATFCVPLQGSIPLEEAAMMLVNPLTALVIFDIARQGGHKALVNTAAASNLGRMILRLGLARHVPVIHIVRRPEQVDLMRSIGAKLVLDSSEPGFDEQLTRLARQYNASLLLDAIGGEMTARLLAAGPPGCTVLCYGLLSKKAACFDPRMLINEKKQLSGFLLSNWQAEQGIFKPLLSAWQVQKLIQSELSPVVQKKLPLAETSQAVDLYINRMTAGKVLLVANPQEVSLD